MDEGDRLFLQGLLHMTQVIEEIGRHAKVPLIDRQKPVARSDGL